MLTRFRKRSEECGICMGVVSLQGQLDSCTHIFCFDCIARWAETENTCPFCKKRFASVKRIAKRKIYSFSRRKPKHVLRVTNKNQNSKVSDSELEALIEVVQWLLTQNLHSNLIFN